MKHLAAACGRTVHEIIDRNKPKVWRHLGDREGEYIKWAATWAFHWAGRARAANVRPERFQGDMPRM